MTRLVGEKPISSIPDQRRSRQAIKSGKIWCLLECSKENCNNEFWLPQAAIKRYKQKNGGSITCLECLKNGKDELKEAIINLAKNKARLKKS